MKVGLECDPSKAKKLSLPVRSSIPTLQPLEDQLYLTFYRESSSIAVEASILNGLYQAYPVPRYPGHLTSVKPPKSHVFSVPEPI